MGNRARGSAAALLAALSLAALCAGCAGVMSLGPGLPEAGGPAGPSATPTPTSGATGELNGYLYRPPITPEASEGAQAIEVSALPLAGRDPWVGATVTTDTGQSATTNASGAYLIKNVPAGLRQLTVTAGGRTLTFQVTCLAGRVVSGTGDVPAGAMGAVNGYVYLAGDPPTAIFFSDVALADYTPATSAQVTAQPGGQSTTPTSEGFFHIAGLSGQQVSVEARATVGESELSETVTVTLWAGTTVPVCSSSLPPDYAQIVGVSRAVEQSQITVPGAGAITGVVQQQNGTVAAGYRVELYPAAQGAGAKASQAVGSTLSGPDGAYGFLNVPPGAYTVVASWSAKRGSAVCTVAAGAVSRTDVIIGLEQSQPPPTGSRLVFAADTGDGLEIFVSGPNAEDPVQLTNTAGTNEHPCWSPDGQHIALVSTRPPPGGLIPGGTSIWIINADGSEPRQLASLPQATHLHWSPDGQKIAASGVVQGKRQIVLIDVQTGEVTPLTNTSGSATAPRWSPDGEWIAYADQDETTSWDIYKIRPDGTLKQRLTDSPGVDTDPCWSPDGQQIAFCSEREASAGRQIYLMPAGGGVATRLTPGGGVCSDLSWAPDGSRIVFAWFHSLSGTQIWTVDLSGQTTQLTQGLTHTQPEYY